MPAKADPSGTAPAAPAAPAPEPAAAPPAAKKKSAAALLGALAPIASVLIAAPLLTWAVAQFVLLPQLEQRLAAGPGGEAPAKPAGGEETAAEPKKGEPGATTNTYEFNNIVVNLAGTMGTRYLKTSFLVTGTDTTLHATFDANKPKLLDVTLNVLSSLSLSDLEETGAKNIIREKLVLAYNQALGKQLAGQIYFSDFVVQ
ncbi:MAG: flagellar basal body-associated FliL family protein [Opitutaceae bacterium]|nr:flagellar basal body-associated FliL family protein [Opitutaceae bacterium]